MQNAMTNIRHWCSELPSVFVLLI